MVFVKVFAIVQRTHHGSDGLMDGGWPGAIVPELLDSTVYCT
jgi:hypothetical protein